MSFGFLAAVWDFTKFVIVCSIGFGLVWLNNFNPLLVLCYIACAVVLACASIYKWYRGDYN